MNNNAGSGSFISWVMHLVRWRGVERIELPSSEIFSEDTLSNPGFHGYSNSHIYQTPQFYIFSVLHKLVLTGIQYKYIVSAEC